MNRHHLKGAALCLLALAAVALAVVVLGLVPMRASSGHWPATEWVLRFAMRRSIATQSLGLRAPALDDPGLALKGAAHYEVGCRSCHGGPGLEQSRIARSMLPRPPRLAERIKDRRPEELFYAVKHGLKFTGMPAWAAPGRDDEVWAVVAFLTKLPALDAAGYRAMVHGEPARLASSPEVPAAVTQSCVLCHGGDGLGRGRAAMPILAGQRREYLENALAAYARGERHSGIMEPPAAALDEAAIKRLAAYYSGLKAPAPRKVKDADAVARGEAIAREGILAQRVPSCLACHALGGKQAKDAFPTLAGQPADYLELQLQLQHKDLRGGSAYKHLMQPIAARLTPAQMRDVALYFSTLTRH